MKTIRLNNIAYARSGDKGDISNIVVIAKKPEYYDVIAKEVTEEAVAKHFGDDVKGTIIRYDVPKLNAFNFVLRQGLGGGATRSLRMDFTGKAMCMVLLAIEIQIN